MCVIVIKPPTVGLTKDDINRMWDKNSDGAGLCWIDKDEKGANKIMVRKGIMDVLELENIVAENIDKHLFLHFRLATHGEIEPSLTHPFGITADVEKSKRCESQSVFFHNGIISGYGSSAKGSAVSDSLDFCATVLAALPNNKERLRLLDHIHGKYLIVSPAGENGTYWCSGLYSEVRGLSCSNSFWDQKVITYPSGWSTTQNGRTSYTPRYDSRLNNADYWKQKDLPYDDYNEECCAAGETNVFGFDQKREKKKHKKKRLKSMLGGTEEQKTFEAKIADLLEENGDLQDALDIAIEANKETEH